MRYWIFLTAVILIARVLFADDRITEEEKERALMLTDQLVEVTSESFTGLSIEMERSIKKALSWKTPFPGRSQNPVRTNHYYQHGGPVLHWWNIPLSSSSELFSIPVRWD